MRVKVFCGVFALLMLNAVFLFAQGSPCGGTDPDEVCPLDTWVVVLAVAAFVFAAIHLYRKQKAALVG
jgi:hypothetical protein